MSVNKLKYLILAVFFSATILTACGSSGGGGSAASTPEWVGTWLIQTENGTNVSGLGATFTITQSSLAQVVPNVCALTAALDSSGNNWSIVISSTDCSGTAVGDVETGTFSVSGANLTIVNSTLGVTWVCSKVST